MFSLRQKLTLLVCEFGDEVKINRQCCKQQLGPKRVNEWDALNLKLMIIMFSIIANKLFYWKRHCTVFWGIRGQTHTSLKSRKQEGGVIIVIFKNGQIYWFLIRLGNLKMSWNEFKLLLLLLRTRRSLPLIFNFKRFKVFLKRPKINSVILMNNMNQFQTKLRKIKKVFKVSIWVNLELLLLLLLLQ